jgi:hypothetical protein
MSVPSSDELCKAQFELALELDERYLHISSADEYFFGTAQGLGALALVPPSAAQMTLLDIGAGYGTYLHEAVQTPERNIRAKATASKPKALNGFSAIFNDHRPGHQPKHSNQTL